MKIKSCSSLIIIYLSILCFFSCKSERFSDKNSDLTEVHFSTITIKFYDTLKNSIVINNIKEVLEIVNSLNKSEVKGIWKGVGWDEINLENSNTKIVLYSNGDIFSNGYSGTFYKLGKKLKKYWK